MLRGIALLVSLVALASCAASSSGEGFSDGSDSKTVWPTSDAGDARDAGDAIGDAGSFSSATDAGAHATTSPDAGSARDAGEEAIDAGGPAVVDSGTTPPPPPPTWPADPFTVDTSCTAMSFAELATRFASGASSANVPNFTVVTRTRTSCNAITGCTAWTNSAATFQQTEGVDGTNYAGKTHQMSGAGSMALQLDTLDSPPRINLQTWVAEPSTSNSFYVGFSGPIQGVAAGSFATDNDIFETPGGDSPFTFYGTYESSPEFDSRTIVSWTGRICEDGHYQIVSQLAAQLGTDVTGPNSLNQVAYYGQL